MLPCIKALIISEYTLLSKVYLSIFENPRVAHSMLTFFQLSQTDSLMNKLLLNINNIFPYHIKIYKTKFLKLLLVSVQEMRVVSWWFLSAFSLVCSGRSWFPRPSPFWDTGSFLCPVCLHPPTHQAVCYLRGCVH